MKIITDQPFPLLSKVKEHFPVTDNVIFAYGEDLYAHTADLPTHLLMHEATHSVQQIEDKDMWWDRYLVEPAFRLSQEVEAYRVQYRFYCAGERDRNRRANFLFKIASDLSGPLYGNLCSHQQALALIRNERRIEDISRGLESNHRAAA